jgi:hypothetical protein
MLEKKRDTGKEGRYQGSFMTRDTQRIATHLCRFIAVTLLGLVFSAARGNVSASCPIVVPASPIVVAPNQPEVPLDSITGIINALCDVR